MKFVCFYFRFCRRIAIQVRRVVGVGVARKVIRTTPTTAWECGVVEMTDSKDKNRVTVVGVVWLQV
jgi:hypothetical protein